jgi:hypothetical protein
LYHNKSWWGIIVKIKTYIMKEYATIYMSTKTEIDIVRAEKMQEYMYNMYETVNVTVVGIDHIKIIAY